VRARKQIGPAIAGITSDSMPSWRAPGAYAVSAYANVTSRDSSAPLAGAAPRVTAVIHVEAGVPEIINTPPVTVREHS
jgi:hypothetical protein